MPMPNRRGLALVGLAVSIALLVPGLFAPVISVRGTLDPQGVARLAPQLEAATVRRAWACLRTFAPDRLPVIGPDPRVRGLYWVAGLGGAGMTIGVAAGEMVSALISRRRHPLTAALAPPRLLAGERAECASR